MSDQAALYAQRPWIEGVPMTDRFQVITTGSPNGLDLSDFPLLSIGVEGSDESTSSGPNSALASVQYDTEGERTGAAGGYVRFDLAAGALSLGRGPGDEVSEVLVTITAAKVTGETRVLANIRVTVSDSGMA